MAQVLSCVISKYKSRIFRSPSCGSIAVFFLGVYETAVTACHFLPDEEIRRNVIHFSLNYSHLLRTPDAKSLVSRQVQVSVSLSLSLGLVSTFCSIS